MIPSGDHELVQAELIPLPHDVLEAYLHHLATTGLAKETIRAYRSALRRVVGMLPAGLLATTEELQEALWYWSTPATRAVYRAAIRGFYHWLAKTGQITWDPSTDLAKVRRKAGIPRPVHDDELRIILTEAKEPIRFWSLLMAYAGARCIEVSRLDRADIREPTTRLHGKGDRERLVPTHPLIWAAAQHVGPGLIAGGRSPQAISLACGAEYRRIGLKVTAHQLRHWFGTMVQQLHRDIRVTQELLGHASVATTQVYTQVATEAKRTAVLALPSATPAGAVG